MSEANRSTYIIAAIIGAIGVISASVIGVTLQNKRQSYQRYAQPSSQRQERVGPERESEKRDVSLQQDGKGSEAQSTTQPAPKPKPEPGPSTTPTFAAGPLYDWPFQFRFAKCAHVPRGPVQCTVLVENSSDKSQYFLPDPVYHSGARLSFLADPSGVEYPATPTGGPDLAASDVPLLQPHVQNSLYLAFLNVPDSLRTAMLVVQADHGINGRHLSVAFQNIPIN